MLLADLVEARNAVRATRSRKAKTAALATALASAEPDEVETVTSYLSGTLRQRRTGLGWRSLSALPAPATSSSLTVAEVHDTFEEMSGVAGAGSQARRTELAERLFGRATADEQDYLRGLVTGELRQGALDGLVLEAVAVAADVPAAAVRRASMFAGSTPPVAAAALAGGVAALEGFALQPGRPIRPMLASSAAEVDEAMTKALPTGRRTRVAVDSKLDGIRIQVHKLRRTGARVHPQPRGDHRPGARGRRGRRAAARAHARARRRGDRTDRGRPRLAPSRRRAPAPRAGSTSPHCGHRCRSRRTSSTCCTSTARTSSTHPARERFERLSQTLPPELVVPRTVTADPDEAKRLFADVVAAGHEGVVVKSLDAPYEAGRRGAGWVKVKPRHTLDLVVLAVEWGSGRRRGWLSNIHLGARDPDADPDSEERWVMLGKTFKGMTDEMLQWQTERFLALEESRTQHVVHVRPEQVVEIAFDGIQTSTRYPARHGAALRAGAALPRRQDRRRGRHRRDGEGPARLRLAFTRPAAYASCHAMLHARSMRQ